MPTPYDALKTLRKLTQPRFSGLSGYGRGRNLNLEDPILTKRNLSLDVELYKKVRAECVNIKYPLSFLVSDLLQEWIDNSRVYLLMMRKLYVILTALKRALNLEEWTILLSHSDRKSF